MKISNKFYSEQILPISIDRTINSKLRKTKIIPFRIKKSKNLDLFSLYINYQFISSDAYKVLHVDLSKSKWNKRIRESFPERLNQNCIRCGHISLKKEYCDSCEQKDFYDNFHSILVNKGYLEAFSYYRKAFLND